MKNYFDGLINNALKMAEQLTSFDINIESTKIDVMLNNGGIDVSIDDIQVDLLSGILTYQGRSIILYIPDHSYGNNFEQVMRGNLNQGRKLHLSWCATIEEMKSKNRLQRYLAVQTKENSFKITNQNEVGYTPLLVCFHCLSQLNYKNFNRQNQNNKNKVRLEFNFEEFLKNYTTYFNELPDYIGQDRGGYTTDWVNISTMYRTSKNYICEKCGVNLSSRKGLLHVHHKNGVKQDNRFDNLQALCVLCHGDEPFHEHMSSIVQKARVDILTLRQEQNLR